MHTYLKRVLSELRKGVPLDFLSIEWGAREFEQFGWIAPYRCQECGPLFEEPTYYVTSRRTLWDDEDGETACPSCGKIEVCGDNPCGLMPFRVFSRRTISKKSALAA